jgi:hypothetical protein
MCPSVMTCLPADYCFSVLARKSPTQRVGLQQNGNYHHHLAENLPFSP